MRSKREVRYVVCRLANPADLEGKREMIGCHPDLDLAKKHADRIGPEAFVDAQGGSYCFDGPYNRRKQWQVDWTNPNLYQGKHKRDPVSEV